jgi:K+-sensing histidine kinase KdpD
MKKSLEDVYLSSLQLLVPSSPQETYKIIIDEATKLVNAKCGTLFLGHQGTLSRVYSTVPSKLWVEPREKGYTYKSYISGQARVISRAQLIKYHPEFEPATRSIIFIPLFFSNSPSGVLALQSSRPAFKITPNQIKLLHLFGSMASLAIKKAQAHYEAVEEIKKRELFISLASHELKTPLTVIKLSAQLLRSQLKKEKSAHSDWTEKLLSEVDRLQRVVYELLRLDKLKTGSFKFASQPVSLKHIIETAITNSHITHPDKRYIFTDKIHEAGDTLVADDAKLLQIFINLLNNAAKFSPADSAIRVMLANSGHQYRISIQDEGMGIPEKDLLKIFKPFYRGSNNQIKDGMGVGLSLVKMFIDRLGGQISITSKVGIGTTIKLTLPKESYSHA